MKFAVVLFLACQGLALCQVIVPTVEPKTPETLTRVFPIRYADPDALRKVFAAFESKIDIDNNLRALTARAPLKTLNEIESTLARFDVPGAAVRDVELTAYLLVSLEQEAAGSSPAELEPVVSRLKSIFNYKGFALIDTQVMRLRPGSPAEVTGSVDRSDAGLAKAVTRFKVASASTSKDEKGTLIRLDGLRLGLETVACSGAKPAEAGFTTSIDVREGQKAVVGKAKIDGSERTSVLVVTARLVE